MQRENTNRKREEDMKRALQEWRQTDPKIFRKLVKKEQVILNITFQWIEFVLFSKQEEIYTTTPISNTSTPTSPIFPTKKSSAKNIHCRYCNEYLCAGTNLRLQGSTVVCVDPYFESHVKPPQTRDSNIVFYLHSSFEFVSIIGKIICPQATCQREIGNVIILQKTQPGYVLQITALKFYFYGEVEPQIFKKWGLYLDKADISQLQINWIFFVFSYNYFLVKKIINDFYSHSRLISCILSVSSSLHFWLSVWYFNDADR